MELENKLNCILLVDDDEATNFLHKFVINRSKCVEKIEEARNGMQALDFLKEKTNGVFNHPDLIFLDINMPGINGWEFLEEYEKLPAALRAKAIIVMLTTSLNPADEKRAEEFKEISSFRNKPITNEMLDEIMKEYFPEHILKTEKSDVV